MGNLGDILPLVYCAVLLAGLVCLGLEVRDRNRRVRLVERVATEAADEDRAFSPAFVHEAARRLFREVQAARGRSDAAALAELVAPGLLAEERRRIDELAYRGWRRHIELPGRVHVEYVGLVNREPADEDRVTVRISATVVDYFVRADGREVWPMDRDHIDFVGENHFPSDGEAVEFWTLAKRPDGRNWMVFSIEGNFEGEHALDAQLVASPSDDLGRMTDASLLEVAALDKLPEQVRVAEVFDVDYADDARTAALDLSLVDGRWAPVVLEASVRRAVAAWAAAVDGGNRDLREIASTEVAHAMLHPGDPLGRTKLVLRDAHVQHVTITTLDPDANPPRMTVEFEVHGQRYIKQLLTGAEVAGSRSTAVTETERWTLALSGPDEQPWQIVALS